MDHGCTPVFPPHHSLQLCWPSLQSTDGASIRQKGISPQALPPLPRCLGFTVATPSRCLRFLASIPLPQQFGQQLHRYNNNNKKAKRRSRSLVFPTLFDYRSSVLTQSPIVTGASSDKASATPRWNSRPNCWTTRDNLSIPS